MDSLRMLNEDKAIIRFANKKIHVLFHPELIKEVLVTKQKSFQKSTLFGGLKIILGDGLLTSEDPKNRIQRKLIQPSFTRSQLLSYSEKMTDITKQFIDLWENEEFRDIDKNLMEMTLAIISSTMFSFKIQDGYEQFGEIIRQLMESITTRQRSFIKIPLSILTKKNKAIKKSMESLDQIIYEIIENRRHSDKKEMDLLQVLLDATNEETMEQMTNNQLKDELMTIFLAGHETTAIALSWSLYLLAKHPYEQTKVIKEIIEVVGDRSVQFTDLTILKYTQSTILETLRIYPPAWIVAREAAEDTDLMGYKIKKGEHIFISQYVTHRDEKYFKDAHVFKPNRFENGRPIDVHEYAYFPFGGGSRICIGNHFALMEATMILVTILQKYKVLLPSESKEVELAPLITLRPKNGIKLRIQRRL